MSHVFLAVPTRGYVYAETAARLQAIRDTHSECPPVHYEPGHLSVSYVRNMIVKKFLASEAEWLLMIDDDVVPSMNVLELCKPPGDVVAAPCLIFREEYDIPAPAVFQQIPDGYTLVPNVYDRHGRVRCDATGTGCITINRRVLEHPGMRNPFSMQDDEQENSDDFAFFNRLNRVGEFEIYADYDLFADHCPGGISLNRIHVGYGQAFAHMKEKMTCQ